MPEADGSRRLQEALKVFDRAASRPEGERAEYVAEACAGDPELRRLVAEMLAADAEGTSPLDVPLLRRAGSAGERADPIGRGREIGPYRLLRKIGEGGMGSVFLAMRDDPGFRRRVVIKRLRPGMESDDLLRRFKTESQILASLDHPNIARIYDGGTTEDGLPYFVMEYVEGEPIDAYCDRNRLPVGDRLELFLKVCSAVQAAHQSLVVHRDLKPSNVLVAADDKPKLLDFGIAKLLDPERISPDAEPTVTGQRLMTPHYASPEQVRGQMIATTSDVYSLGVLLYKLLTGSLPFRFPNRSPREIERILTEQEPERPSTAVERGSQSSRPEDRDENVDTAEELALRRSTTPRELSRQLSGDLDAIVLKALRTVPRERYASVGQLAEDIERYRTGQPVSAYRGSWRYRTVKLVRRNRKAVAAVAAMVAMLLAFAGGMAIMLQRLAEERDRVTEERDLVTEERNRAEAERRKKERFLDWVLDLFARSDPYVSNEEHASITVRQALDRSLVSLEQEAEDPRVRSEMLHAIGVVYRNLGLYEQAEEQLRKSLEIRRALYGDEHAEVARCESALATVLQEQDEEKLRQAEILAAEATATLEKLTGRSGVEFLEALNTQVSVLCYRRDYQAVEPLAEEAVALSRALGADDFKLAQALGNLATAKSSLGDYETAADLYRQSVELRRSRYGADSPWLVTPLINLGVAYRQLGQLEAAARSYHEALAIQEQVLGRDHPELFPALFNLARLQQAAGQPRQALDLFEQAAENLQRNAGADHPNLLLVELRREEVRIELGDAATAAERLRGLLDRWRARLDPAADPRLALTESVLGQALRRLGRAGEAEELLRASYDRLLAVGKHRHQREAAERLLDLLEEQGRQEEAAALRASLEASTAAP